MCCSFLGSKLLSSTGTSVVRWALENVFGTRADTWHWSDFFFFLLKDMQTQQWRKEKKNKRIKLWKRRNKLKQHFNTRARVSWHFFSRREHVLNAVREYNMHYIFLLLIILYKYVMYKICMISGSTVFFFSSALIEQCAERREIELYSRSVEEFMPSNSYSQWQLKK